LIIIIIKKINKYNNKYNIYIFIIIIKKQNKTYGEKIIINNIDNIYIEAILLYFYINS